MARTKSGDRTARLRTIPLFAGLSGESLGRIAEAMTEFEAAPGQVLIQQGQPGSGLLIVEDGAVVVERPGTPSIELGPGEFVGELALLTPEGTHTARVRAKGSAVLLAIGRSDFARLLQGEPGIAVAMLSGLAARLAATIQRA